MLTMYQTQRDTAILKNVLGWGTKLGKRYSVMFQSHVNEHTKLEYVLKLLVSCFERKHWAHTNTITYTHK